ncbi:Extracellular ligand-binding receptor [Conexibacter woesei DSM 14684]|uniref:Extracellular ligand-binding receptor n=1 Tax=Conexibacter woesei (strain DSM 14684 / CCUG 47730 / CIP 108061 / JCM 11494 / NBRC 100937 / ID131577) TaxID=469383 RepID=D3F3M2_CONWI|nr:Extracellular ligand-binding receptor [Conexibacter woesei DSM 14684]
MLLIALVTGAALLTAGCGGSSSSGGKDGSLDLVIGDSAPLSGDLADFGPPTQKAADLAMAQIDAAIERAGVDHNVSLVHEDNCGGSDQQCAVQATRKLATSDKSTCIAGPWASSDVVPAAESVAIPEEVVLMLPASTGAAITDLKDGPGFVNRTAYRDSFQGSALANYVAKALGGAAGKTVNIGARNDAYGTGLAETFQAAWEKLGGKVGEKVVYDVDLASYDTEAERITSGDPDGTVILDFPETYNKVGPALARTGKLDVATTFMPDGMSAPAVIKSAGANATVGIRGTVPGLPKGDPGYVAFDKAYRAAAPKDVARQAYDAQAFDSVMLCYLAAAAARSSDGPDIAEHIRAVSGPPGKKYGWLDLAEAIEALQRGEEIDYQGVSGPIDLDDNGDPSAGIFDIFRFERDGTMEIVDQIPVEAPS